MGGKNKFSIVSWSHSIIIRADHLIRRHGYSDHFVMVCVGVYASRTERKRLITDLKLGTAVGLVHDNVLKLLIFGGSKGLVKGQG